MKFIITILFVFSSSAFAHFNIGTYKGASPEGAECSVVFEKVAFTTEFRHPLAERVTVRTLNKSFLLQHLYKVDENLGSVVYSEESLETTIPFKGGAEFFKVAMGERNGEEGPTYFIHLIHDWKNGKMSKTICDNLVFQEEAK